MYYQEFKIDTKNFQTIVKAIAKFKENEITLNLFQ